MPVKAARGLVETLSRHARLQGLAPNLGQLTVTARPAGEKVFVCAEARHPATDITNDELRALGVFARSLEAASRPQAGEPVVTEVIHPEEIEVVEAVVTEAGLQQLQEVLEVDILGSAAV